MVRTFSNTPRRSQISLATSMQKSMKGTNLRWRVRARRIEGEEREALAMPARKRSTNFPRSSNWPKPQPMPRAQLDERPSTKWQT